MSYRVREVQVEAQYKEWGSVRAGAGGGSGGTVLRWVLEPGVGEEPWTREEAQAVTLAARRELQALLLCDAEARGCQRLPDNGPEALTEYDRAVASVRDGGESGGWESVPAAVAGRGFGPGGDA